MGKSVFLRTHLIQLKRMNFVLAWLFLFPFILIFLNKLFGCFYLLVCVCVCVCVVFLFSRVQPRFFPREKSVYINCNFFFRPKTPWKSTNNYYSHPWPSQLIFSGISSGRAFGPAPGHIVSTKDSEVLINPGKYTINL